MTFKSVVYQETKLPLDVLERFKKFRENGKFCDVTLIVNDEEFHAHKIVLAACSPYFESVLKSHRVVSELLTIPVPMGNAKAFQSILTYFYTGSLTLESNTIVSLLYMSNFLLLFKLKAFVADVMESAISNENVLAFRETALKLFVPELHQAANDYIENNLEAVKPSLLRVEFQKLEEILKDKRLKLGSPAVLTSLIIDWICFRFEKRFVFLRILLTFVDWTNVSADEIVAELTDTIQAKELIPVVLNVIEELKSNQSVPPPKSDPIDARIKLERMAIDAAIESLASQDNSSYLRDDLTEEENSDDDSSTTVRDFVGKFEELAGETEDSDEEDLLLKSNNASADDGVRCEKCTFTVHGQDAALQLETHYNRVHSHQIKYKCFLCGYVCLWKRQFLDHLKDVHFPKNPPFRCDICDIKTEKISTLVQHRRKHLTDRPFTCDLCSYRCRFSAQLLEHCRSHKVDRPYTCRWCRRAFAVKMALDIHLRVHQGERYLRCDRCSFRTRYQHHLAVHRRMHLRQTIACPQGCDFTAVSSREMEKHIRTHPQDRTHVCQTCGKTFPDKTHLTRHTRSHSVKPNRC